MLPRYAQRNTKSFEADERILIYAVNMVEMFSVPLLLILDLEIHEIGERNQQGA